GNVLWSYTFTGRNGIFAPPFAGATIVDGVLYFSFDRLFAFTLPHGNADLAVTGVKSDGFAGDFVYTLDVQNNGPTMAWNVSFSDTIPAATTLVSVRSSQGRCTATAPVTCSLGQIDAGSDAFVTVEVHAAAPGTFVDHAEVSSTSDTTSGNNSV